MASLYYLTISTTVQHVNRHACIRAYAHHPDLNLMKTMLRVRHPCRFTAIASSIVETVSWQATQQHGTFIANGVGDSVHIASGAQITDAQIKASADIASESGKVSSETSATAAGAGAAYPSMQFLQSLQSDAGSSNTLNISEKAHDSYTGHLISVQHSYQVKATLGSNTFSSEPVSIVLQPRAAAGSSQDTGGSSADGGKFEEVDAPQIRRTTQRVVAFKDREPSAWEGILEIKASKLLRKKHGQYPPPPFPFLEE